MKNLLLATALFLAGTLFGAHIYQASADTPPGGQPPGAPPSGQPMPPPGPWGAGPHGPWGMGGMGGMAGMPGMDHHGFPGGPMPGGIMDHHHDDAFALFAHVDNKNLTQADVKIIAEATLLEHGNHNWTVTNVTKSGQNINFSYASPHGDIIATFAIDPATGHIHRVS